MGEHRVIGEHLFFFSLQGIKKEIKRKVEKDKGKKGEKYRLFSRRKREKEKERRGKKGDTWRRKKEKEGEHTVVGEHLFYFSSRHKGRNKEKSREGRKKGKRKVALVFKRKEI